MVLSLRAMSNSHDDAIWDQIQTSLESLNSDYEKRSKILAEIQATCTKICATLNNHQRLQQPPIFQFQAKSNSEFPLLSNNSTKLATENSIITDLRFWNSDPEYQIAELESTTAKASESARNPEITEEVHIKGEEGDSSDFKFTFQPQQQTKSTQVADRAIIQHSSLSICNYYDAVSPFQQQQQTSCLNSTLIDAENEEEATDLAEVEELAFNFEFQPVESTAISVQAGFQNSIPELQSKLPIIPEHTREEHLDLHLAHLEETALAEEKVVIQGGGSAVEELNRPPPKPPYSLTKAAVGPATATGAGKTAVLPRASGAIAKVEGNDIVHEGGRWAQSSENDDSTTSAPTRGRDLQACGFRCVSPLVARPPKLLVAVFPWDRGGGRHIDDWQWRAAVLASGRGNTTASGAGAALILHGGSDAEDGALARGQRTLLKALVGGAATGKGRDLHSRWFSCGLPMAAIPSPLMAASFPWDRAVPATSLEFSSGGHIDGGTRGCWLVSQWAAREEGARKKREVVTEGEKSWRRR
ncbi:uncharacterized protein LOC130982967 [Arachis stenosperma]|uniref:uncharacterized protein LOC130982967 n=1 Tax=Arachis stenosperma TaxID=217475 RepID=UPI0025AC4B31|nr:uncharacterized protein LOC130982967 [Arachis stenosperma]XP_057763107.1 uncharacterized protein LOC130982967 [Arachis stenosperma]XP_057763108.1 uncharacterized protein LOC130982967 [Arachis stenosperma]XP_057763109.1 uncharacterized protein LOC130982967 [Arachis stenosperma]